MLTLKLLLARAKGTGANKACIRSHVVQLHTDWVGDQKGRNRLCSYKYGWAMRDLYLGSWIK